MDAKLVAWARAVKARMARGCLVPPGGATRGPAPPPLWLFTDTPRLGDPRAAVAALPRRLCGVVLRDDALPGRPALARDLARLCRRRGNVLVVAGDARLAHAVGAGHHLRGGRRPLPLPAPRRAGMITSSAHSAAELRRAARAGAALAFLSPAFATASHPGARALGPARWQSLARHAPPGLRVAALGGIDGATVGRLPGLGWAGAIGALMP